MSPRCVYRARQLILAAFCATMIAGCGPGGSGGTDGGQVAGIEGTGIVSGFGSVYVDGIEFATEHATIIFNGEPATESNLRVGDVVTVDGVIDADGNARADRIVFDRTVDGPIDTLSLSEGTGELTALGQRVEITANTTFVNVDPQNLAANDLIAVSAVAAANGDLRATSIQRGGRYVPGTTRIDVEGVVRDLAGNAFMLGSQRVSFGRAALDQTTGALRNGAYVEVFGVRASGADAVLRADSVRIDARAVGRPGERVFIESIISDFNGLDDFRLNGQPVNAGDAVRTDNAKTAPADGVTASVRGALRDGVVVADSLRISPRPTVTLSARLSGLDVQTGTLDLLGMTARVRPATLYLDSSDADNRRLRIDRLNPGDTLTVSGFSTDTGLIATRIERIDAAANGDARLRGSVQSIQRRGNSALLRVSGVAIRSRDGRTRLAGSDDQTLTPAAFFQRLEPGTPVEAVGPDNADRIDTARSLRIID